jgi:nucleotide-binding universal stress UspA family protein
MPVTPVRSHADDIRRVLDTIWTEEGETRQSGIMGWSANPDDEPALAAYLRALTAALASEETTPISHAPLADFNAQVNVARPMLAVCVATDLDLCQALIAGISTSLLLLRGSLALPQTILHALRGHTPDQRAQDWVIPLAQHYNAEITLLAVANALNARVGNPLMSDIARLILPEHPAQVVEYGQMLASMKVRGRIRVADGLLQDVLIQTSEVTPYDLVAIATENNGKFVQSLLARLNDNTSAFLVIKP